MSNTQTSLETRALRAEERLVAELSDLGIGYLSRRSATRPRSARAPGQLLADIVCQPSSRVRTAFIAVLLAHPEYAAHVLNALHRLPSEPAQTLKFFYTAAVILQRQYQSQLQPFLGASWLTLPRLFGDEFPLPADPRQQLQALARLHQERTGQHLNWAGTYEHAALSLLRRWQMEKLWTRSRCTVGYQQDVRAEWDALI